MNTLSLKIIGAEKRDVLVSLDGKYVRIRRGKGGARLVSLDTENDSVHISVRTHLETREPLWWLTSIFFFIISIFGNFDIRPNRKCRAIGYEGDVFVTGKTELTLKLLPWSAGREAITSSGDDVIETENVCFIDTTALKRRKLLKFIKVFVTIAIVALVGIISFTQ